MASINIYKINSDNKNDLIQDLLENDYSLSGHEEIFEIESNYLEHIQFNFSMSFYSYDNQEEQELAWNWIRQEFDLGDVMYRTKPKGVLLIREVKSNSQTNEQIDENIYAVSFGYAFHTLKQYADRNWPLTFAEHIKINQVKSMTILSPNSVINRRINNYMNFKQILLNSGEALNKLNANLDIDEGFESFKSKITISNSIIFEVNNPNLLNLAQIIDYVNFINNSDEIVNSIPYFKQIDSKIKKEELDGELIRNIWDDIENENENPCIDICEFMIIDGYVKFLDQFENFQLKYGIQIMEIDILTIKNIYSFIKDNLNENDSLFDIIIIFKETESGNVFSYKFKNLIIYDNQDYPYILDDGDWYTYNAKYLQDLQDSISDLDVIYEPEFDFFKEDYLNFVKERARENGIDWETEPEKHKKCKEVWYKERVFNLMRVNDGYICNDRFDDYVGNHKIEVADLFNLDEKSMYAVKIGAPSNLNYVVDQSLVPMRMIDAGEIVELNNAEIGQLHKDDIKNVYLWLILKRSRHLHLIDGQPDLNELNSIILKNKINYWKKEVIMSRRNPKIRINYINF